MTVTFAGDAITITSTTPPDDLDDMVTAVGNTALMDLVIPEARIFIMDDIKWILNTSSQFTDSEFALHHTKDNGWTSGVDRAIEYATGTVGIVIWGQIDNTDIFNPIIWEDAWYFYNVTFNPGNVFWSNQTFGAGTAGDFRIYGGIFDGSPRGSAGNGQFWYMPTTRTDMIGFMSERWGGQRLWGTNYIMRDAIQKGGANQSPGGNSGPYGWSLGGVTAVPNGLFEIIVQNSNFGYYFYDENGGTATGVSLRELDADIVFNAAVSPMVVDLNDCDPFITYGLVGANPNSGVLVRENTTYNALIVQEEDGTVPIDDARIRIWRTTPSTAEITSGAAGLGETTGLQETFLTSQAFTSELMTTVTTHPFSTGDKVLNDKDGGVQDIGLDDQTEYFVNNQGASSLSLHNTLIDARNDTNRVNLTTSGSETHILKRQGIPESGQILLKTTEWTGNGSAPSVSQQVNFGPYFLRLRGYGRKYISETKIPAPPIPIVDTFIMPSTGLTLGGTDTTQVDALTGITVAIGSTQIQVTSTNLIKDIYSYVHYYYTSSVDSGQMDIDILDDALPLVTFDNLLYTILSGWTMTNIAGNVTIGLDVLELANGNRWVPISITGMEEYANFRVSQISDDSTLYAGEVNTTNEFLTKREWLSSNIPVRTICRLQGREIFEQDGTIGNTGLIVPINLINDLIYKAIDGRLRFTHFRWRDDDGSESGATFHQLEDVDHTGQAKNDNLRLRVQIEEFNKKPNTHQLKLQYREVGNLPWIDIE